MEMNRRLFAASFCGVILLASAAQAGGNWSVGIGFGGPGYHHHHHRHHDCFGFSYWPAPYYYAPPPVVYSPPVVYTQPTYITVPAAQSAAPATSTNMTAAAPRTNALAPYRGSGVTIKNPIASGTSLGFVVDSRTEAALAPGDSMPLVEKGSYFVEFDRGGEFGTARRTVTEGSYEFVATPNGWDLQRATEAAVPTPVVRRNSLPQAQ
jgi:hypothetical protein